MSELEQNQELVESSEFNNPERETIKFRKELPIEVLANKRLRKAFGIKIPPRVLPKKIGRNEICPCGSNKKFKHCCIDIYEREQM